MRVTETARKAILLAALCAGAAACSPRSAAPVATLAPFPADAGTACPQEEVLPRITEVQPDAVTPGSQVTLIASGGYFKDTCGGYNESARSYQVFLDDEPAGELQCYAGHCQGTFTLPDRAGVGRHCLGVQKGTCQMELDVVSG